MITAAPPAAPIDCPLIATQARIETLSADMALALRQIREDLQACDECPLRPQDCPVLESLNAAVQAAIQEICDEWNLTAHFRREE